VSASRIYDHDNDYQRIELPMPSPSVNNNAKQASWGAGLPASTALFAGINEEQVAETMAAAYSKKVDANQWLYQEGDKANRLFLLGAGRVKFYRISKKGDEVLLSWFSPGDAFGLGAVLQPPYPYIGTTEAVQDCEVYAWQQPGLGQLVRDCPQLVENTLRIVLRHLRAYADQIVEVVTQTAEQRVARTLLHLGDETGRIHSDGVEVQVTNEHLSALAHVSPFTASRLLNKWKRSGRVEKKRGKVLIHSPEHLVID
jgi:CRP/FNR family transcriptional regulator